MSNRPHPDTRRNVRLEIEAHESSLSIYAESSRQLQNSMTYGLTNNSLCLCRQQSVLSENV